ncbi:MAG TPA: PEP-CTERM sorting domain-containing protein [Candidatus Limnocylindrales bacterium]|nr:PEP-CTERM sorting domain-containing protein [Candidatus Limnocylindrales bacterium]
MNWNRFALRLCVASGIGLFGTVSQAAIVETDAISHTGFAVLSTDLINGLTPTSISGTTDQEGLLSNTAGTALTNGLFGPPALVEGGPNPDLTIINNGASITYSLLAPATIMEIDTFTGWRDAGRSQQSYIILVSSNGTDFAPLFTVASQFDTSGTNPSDERVAITNTGNTPLATNVEAIRFDFPTTQNGYVGYREIDVLGSSSATPEPGSMALLSFGALALLARRLRSGS